MKIAFATYLNITFLIFTQNINGQITFTQYTNNSVLFNPAYTGHFNNDTKIGGGYRTQQGNQKQSFSKSVFHFETKILKNRLDNNDCLAVGIVGINDIGSKDGINNNTIAFSAAYKKSLNENGEQFLSAGFQASFSNYKLNKPSYVFESQLVAWGNYGYSNIDLFSFNNAQVNYFDVNVGISYQGVLNDRNLFSLGGALFHITKPNKLFQGGELKIEQQAWGHLGWENKVNENDKINASVLLGYQRYKLNVLTTGLFYKKMVKKRNSISIGTFFKKTIQNGSFIVPQIGLQFRDIDLNISNDITLSSKSLVQRNAFEISMNYFFSKSQESFIEKRFIFF